MVGKMVNQTDNSHPAHNLFDFCGLFKACTQRSHIGSNSTGLGFKCLGGILVSHFCQIKVCGTCWRIAFKRKTKIACPNTLKFWNFSPICHHSDDGSELYRSNEKHTWQPGLGCKSAQWVSWHGPWASCDEPLHCKFLIVLKRLRSLFWRALLR